VENPEGTVLIKIHVGNGISWDIMDEYNDYKKNCAVIMNAEFFIG